MASLLELSVNLKSSVFQKGVFVKITLDIAWQRSSRKEQGLVSTSPHTWCSARKHEPYMRTESGLGRVEPARQAFSARDFEPSS
jgi:hypothetical protein